MYNLNEEDIKEIENWYFRRYPKLAGVIEQKLKEKMRKFYIEYKDKPKL